MSKSIKLNAFYKSVLSVLNIIFPLVTAPYVARVLSVGGFTEYNKAISIIGWFSPFAVFGVYTYGMRTVSQIKNDKKKVSVLFTKLFAFNIFTSVLVTAVYVIMVLLVPSFLKYRNIYLILASQIFFVCFAIDYVNEAFESYGFILVKTFLCRFLYVVSVFVFVRKSDGIFVYVFLTSLSLILNNIFTFFYAKSKIKFSRICFKDLTSLFKPLSVVFLLVNSSMLYTIFDRFMLVWFSDALSLTYYNVSQTIILAVVNVTTSVLLVSIPRLSFYWAEGKKDEYYSLLEKSSSSFMALHTPCCIGMATLSFEVFYIYAGSKYLSGSIALCLFSVRYYFSAFDMILAKQVLLATGNEKILTKIYYSAGIFNILCKVVLVLLNKLTPELCIITTASSDILVVFLQILFIRKLGFKFSIFSKNNFKYLMTSILFIPIVLLIQHLIPFEGIKYITFRTILSIIVCTLLYMLMMFITKDDFIYSILKRSRK
ncbi:oligosaccharide flippase family protein [uncultured Treponema sp.]|uniref:oligosaccharide flippase family protein n=1 Tax=uncultured Treponema sp. TaxID=162155 RepID=UPI0025E4EAE7|nr:oligosaccharide flippase family protein [uncultured Treponema sp.]